MARMRLSIEGMSCNHCVNAVRSALEAIPGVDVEDVKVGEATIAMETREAEKDVRPSIEDEGFTLAAMSELPLGHSN